MKQRVSVITLGVSDLERARAFYEALGWGGVTLALNLGSPAEVDTAIEEARAAGATIGREPAETFWGGYSGVFVDLDGHPWEVAHNPHWQITETAASVSAETGRALRREVVGQEAEGPPTGTVHSPEVTVVEAKDVGGLVLLGQDHDRGVGQSDAQVLVLPHHRPRRFNVAPTELRQLVSPIDDLGKQGELLLLSMALDQHVVELGEDEGRKQEGAVQLLDHAQHVKVTAPS
jgi:hypothetical protein